MCSSRSKTRQRVSLWEYFLLAHRTSASPYFGTYRMLLNWLYCFWESGLSLSMKWQQRILVCYRNRRSSASNCLHDGYNVYSLQSDSASLRTNDLQKDYPSETASPTAPFSTYSQERDYWEGRGSGYWMGWGGQLIRRSFDSMVSSSMTICCPGYSSISALVSPKSPKDSSSSSSSWRLRWMTSESWAQMPVCAQLFIKQWLAYTLQNTHPHTNLQASLTHTSQSIYIFIMELRDSAQSASKQESGLGKKLLGSLWTMARSQNLEILREEEARRGSAESLQDKANLQNSIICLLVNLLGLSGLNMARGLNPGQHEMRHRWSLPLHIFFLFATSASVCAVGLFGHRYSSNSPQEVQQIFAMAADPRIFLDVDKVRRQGDRLEVVPQHLRGKIESS